LPAAKKMKVKVRHYLSPFRTTVYYQSITFPGHAFFLGQILGYDYEASGKIFLSPGEFSHGCNMCLGYDEHMCGRLRHDIPESQEIFVLIDYVGGYLTGNDSAKNTFFGHSSSFNVLRLPDASY
jgi:hypothetical protein